MPRASLEHTVEALLGEERGGRYLDLRLDLVREQGRELLHAAGGRWDRAAKVFDGKARTRRVLTLHEGQVAAARWLAGWIVAHRTRRHVLTEGGKPVFSCALVGGRRGGKTVLGMRALLAYLVENPGAVGWIVVPTFPEMPEMQAEVDEQIPRAWRTYRENEWTLANGSKIYVRSSHDPDDLKRGRADVVVINEAQKHDERAFAIVRPAIADRGGLVILTANPPDTARGEWVAEFVDRARAGKAGSVVFELDPLKNPHVDHAALLSLKDELDERTYRREILGEFLSRDDTVMFGFSPSESVGNVREIGRGPAGERLENVTRAFTRRMLGNEHDRVHGLDFQLRPYMAAATLEFYRDPEDPTGVDVLGWYVDDIEVEQATEDDLITALEARPGSGPADAVIPDATGAFQDAERKKGHGSWDTFRARGWRHLYYPVASAKTNPHKTERLAIANGLFRAANGRRRLFVAPHCRYLIRALRLWEMRNGVPHWRSDYAHIIDAATYPLCRLFPRRAPAAAARAVLIPGPTRVGGMDGLR